MRTTSWLIGLLLLLVLSLSGGYCLAAEPTIYVAAIITDESEILTAAEIAAITEQYVGKAVTVAQLNEVVAKLNQLYEQKGFITARAILPAQTVEQGVVRIRLVEGRVGTVEVIGNKTASSAFYTRRIRLTPGELVRLDRISQDVGYFNRLNSDQVQVQLQPGKEFGTTDFLLVVNPALDQRVIFIDNGGRADTGLYRIGATYVRNHLLRRGDPLTLSGVWAEGMLAGSVAYQLPIGTRGARLSAGYDSSKVRVLSPDFEDLKITGYTADAHLEFSYPWLVTSSLVASSPIQFHRKFSNTTISESSLTGTIVRTAAVGVNLQWQTPRFNAVGGCSYQVGDMQLADDEAEEVDKFQKMYCSVTGQAGLVGKLALKMRGAIQTSKGLLPTTEQLTIGGLETVRGHAEGALSGDRGYYVGLELEAPIGERVAVSVFADHGGTFQASDVTKADAEEEEDKKESTERLTGYGAGLSVRLFSGFNLKVTYGLSQKGKSTLHAALQLAF